MEDRTLVKAAIVEFIGPFTLVFAGVGAIIQTQGQNLVAIALAHGLAIGLLITAVGHISGGHFNPAITIGFLLTGRIALDRAVVYIVAQLLGGLAGAAALTVTYLDTVRNVEGVNLGVPSIGPDHSAGNALVMEIILTFFLMFVIYGVAVDFRTSRFVSGLAIGLTITMDIFAGGVVSGAVMNPARALGPAIVQLGDGNWGDIWIWIIGPIAGAAGAAFLYNNVILSGEDSGPATRRSGEEETQVTGGVSEDTLTRSRRSTRRSRR